ncbi:myosin light chain 2 [Homo sapiens]|uniref:Myosin light chain 2 n=1 Tax=Homo sapiens TaxID=9606 RepID=A0A590UK07_HUMAN|nr:myosin light chain 2 [Homo sapiens]KAI4068250.1 myosin light chain 2 [Homo sapiens]
MAPKKAKKRAGGANSNVFSMFEQTQIQEFKEVGAAIESSAWMEIPPTRENLLFVPYSQQGPFIRCLYPPNNPKFGLNGCVNF